MNTGNDSIVQMLYIMVPFESPLWSKLSVTLYACFLTINSCPTCTIQNTTKYFSPCSALWKATVWIWSMIPEREMLHDSTQKTVWHFPLGSANNMSVIERAQAFFIVNRRQRCKGFDIIGCGVGYWLHFALVFAHTHWALVWVDWIVNLSSPTLSLHGKKYSDAWTRANHAHDS